MNAVVDTDPAERHLLLSGQGAEAIAGDTSLYEQAILVASSFRFFTRYWRFRDADSGAIRSLAELWSGQETAAEEYERHPRLIVLKSRKLGITTLETAFDAWTALTRSNSRVHLFSSKQMAARDILERVVFGLKQLPPWLRPPFLRETADVVALGAGEDVRVLQAYATSENTAVEQLATHSHVDELSRMLAPAKVMQAVEPTFAPEGSAHVLMTSGGSNHWTSDLYRRAKYGDTAFHAVFVPGDARPGRPPQFFEEKARTIGRDAAAREYPRTEEEALMSSGGQVFAQEDIEMAHEDALGQTPPIKRHLYSIGVDVGRYSDATVIVVLDVTAPVHDVVHAERHVRVDGPTIQRRIERLAEAYAGLVTVEDNGPGWAIRENLDLPEHRVEGFATTAKSKPHLIDSLALAFEQQTIRYDPQAWPWMEDELRAYERDDERLVQDAVIALALAELQAGKARQAARPRGRGRVHRAVFFP